MPQEEMYVGCQQMRGMRVELGTLERGATYQEGRCQVPHHRVPCP